jgi:hypothetical protein
MRFPSVFSRFVVVTAATAVVVFAAAAPASAQVPYGLRFVASTPFIVDGRTLPQGTYEIRRAGSGPDVLEIYAPGVAALFMVQNGAPNRHADFDAGVVFEGKGGQRVLRSVWGGVGWGTSDSITAPREIRRLIEAEGPTTTAVVQAFPPAGAR